MVSDKIKDEIKSHALKDYPKECCGIIASKNGETISIPCRNIAEIPEEDFAIHYLDYIKVSRKYEILGFYHSHPSVEEYSKQVGLLDKINSEGEKKPYIIYVVHSDKFLIYEPDGYKNPYVGREYKLGKSDCLTLALDYYNHELNLNLQDFYPKRENDDFFEKSREIWEEKRYLKNIVDCGFKLVKKGQPSLSELKRHDCILTCFYNSEHPSHLLIYLGAGKILHQPRNNFSKIEEYSDFFKTKTFGVIRHLALI